MAGKTRINLTMDPEIHEAIKQAGNVSAYLTRMAFDRIKLSKVALHQLQNRGWSLKCVLGACYALQGFNLDYEITDLPASLRTRLPDDPTTICGAKRINLPPEDWTACLEVLEDPTLCIALWVVAREFWMGNAGFIALIKDGED